MLESVDEAEEVGGGQGDGCGDGLRFYLYTVALPIGDGDLEDPASDEDVERAGSGGDTFGLGFASGWAKGFHQCGSQG